MIIYCDSGGKVTSVPSTLPFGSALTDITIVAFEMAATAVLKIKPPNQQYSPGIVCTPIIQDGVVVYQAKLNKAVTTTFGRCEYQIEFYLQDGEEVPIASTYSGSFNVARGVPVDIPASEELLKEMALDNIYAMLSSVSVLATELGSLMGFSGVGTELQTAAKNLAGAVNELFARPVVYVDKTLTKSGDAADAKVTGSLINALNDEKVNIIDIIDNLTTNDAKKPLSAAQGVILRALVSELNATLENLKKSIVTADKLSEAITEHNYDDEAHPYILLSLRNLSETVSKIDVDGVTDRKINAHNTDEEAHQYILGELAEIRTKLTNFFGVVEHPEALDSLSELIDAITENAEDIEAITASNVKYTDIVNRLDDPSEYKVLSAKQGVELKRLIEEVRSQIATAINAHNYDGTAHAGLREAVDDLDTAVGNLTTKVTALENAKPNLEGYVTTEQLEASLGAYITDIDTLVGGGI